MMYCTAKKCKRRNSCARWNKDGNARDKYANLEHSCCKLTGFSSYIAYIADDSVIENDENIKHSK